MKNKRYYTSSEVWDKEWDELIGRFNEIKKKRELKKNTTKKPKYKKFDKIMLSYGGYCGSVISSDVGIAFGLKKGSRECIDVEIRVKKGEIIIRRKKRKFG